MRTYHELPSVARNELIRIGVLLVDFKRNLAIEVDQEQISFLEVEFIQISLEMIDMWSANGIGLTYYMQSHLAEAKRLLGEINAMISNAEHLTENDELSTFRNLLYSTIREGLTELINTLNSLEQGEGIRLDMGIFK